MVEIIGGNVIQRTAFGNEAVTIPFIGTDTSSGGFGGTSSPIFVLTDFSVQAAIVSFEREFGEADALLFTDAYGDPYGDAYGLSADRTAARIRVRQPIDPADNGFYVDFGQDLDFNDSFILRFNWMAIG